MRRLLYGHLRDGWKDVGVFDADVYRFSRLVRDMAYEGAWRPAVEFLRDAIAEQTGIRDYIDGEKVAHAFMAAHFGMVGQFVIHSERELNNAPDPPRRFATASHRERLRPSHSDLPRETCGRSLRSQPHVSRRRGYADLHLEPFLAAYPDVRYGYVIELKYMKRSESADAVAVSERLERAKTQLRRYLGDGGLRRRQPTVRHIGLALVLHGWELVASEAVEGVPQAA